MPVKICSLRTFWISDISTYLVAAECLNIELYISSVCQSSQNPVPAALFLRAHLLRFLGVIIIPLTGSELIRNRHRNPRDEDQKVILISSKHRLESRIWILTTISFPTNLPSNWLHLKQLDTEKRDSLIYTIVKGFEAKSSNYNHIWKGMTTGRQVFLKERKGTKLLFPKTTHPIRASSFSGHLFSIHSHDFPSLNETWTLFIKAPTLSNVSENWPYSQLKPIMVTL